MRKTILSIAILAAGAAAVPFGFAGGDQCQKSASAGASLVSTGGDGGSCSSGGGAACPVGATAKASTASGCTSEKATLVSTTGGDQCTEKTATAASAGCSEKATLVSTTGGDQCTEKAGATAGAGCSEKVSVVSTGGDHCADKTAATAAKSGCCAGEKAATLVSTDGGAADQATGKPLDALKALSGKWKEVAKAGDTNTNGALEFRVSAAGSVIVETMFPGQKHEMVNTYAMDGDRLLLTHYCASGNQPRMALVSNDGKTMKFKFVDGTNIKSPDAPYMGALELTILGPDRIHEKWTSFEKGKETQHVEFELERVK